MALRLIQFLAIMLTALALVPSGAHLAALPNKMAMAQPAYFIAQQIYAGWALFGIVLFGALAANLAHTIVLCRLGRSFGYKRPTTGPLCLRTGIICVSNGNIPTRQRRGDVCGLGLCGYCGASTAFASEIR